MKPELFVFLGRSGCGKGTQADLLTKYLKSINPDNAVFYVSTGEEFRKFIASDNYSATEARDIVDKGGFTPSFLASMLWTNAIVHGYKKGNHMIVDGSPRTLAEKAIFDTIFDFYGEKKVYEFEAPHIIFINVTKEWAFDKLLKRATVENRVDDAKEAIEKRMYWFENHIAKVVDAYKTDGRVHFHEINGDQTINAVHEDIKKALVL